MNISIVGQNAEHSLKKHLLNKSNPHGITIDTIGAAKAEHNHTSNQLLMEDGTNLLQFFSNEIGSIFSSSKTYTDEKIAALVNSAPETLDTLGELATAFNENKNVTDVLNAAITNKADSNHNHNGVYAPASHTHIAAEVKPTIHTAHGNGDSAQYLRIARFTISSQYQNQSFSLRITQRRLPYVGTVHIQFNGDTDPLASAFAVDEVGLKCYLNRVSQGVFDFYVAKKENWDTIQVVGLDKGSYMDSTAIEWAGENVATLPTGYVEATLVQNQHNYVPDVGDGRHTTFAYSKEDFTSPTYLAVWNGSELRALHKNSICSVIGAAAASHSHNYSPSSHDHYLGVVAPMMNRNGRQGLYTYNINTAVTGGPTTYNAVVGFGAGNGGSVEIAGDWVNANGNLYYRQLRDYQDSWYGWKKIYSENNLKFTLEGSTLKITTA